MADFANFTGDASGGQPASGGRWSNLAAEASGDPCVPVPASTVYVNLQVGGRFPPRIPAGGHQTLNLTGWSTGKVADWHLEADARKPGEVTLTLGATELNAGRSTTLDIALPAAAQAGTIAHFFVFSVLPDNTYETLPMYAIVGTPCASFTGCQACTAQPGCGFCATSGRCENIGASGSADSACPAASFAEGLGDCPGYCASHNGSCTDCASQPGCGWCEAGATPQCVGIDHATLLPANNACTYASWDLTPGYCPMQRRAARRDRRTRSPSKMAGGGPAAISRPSQPPSIAGDARDRHRSAMVPATVS